MDTFSNIGLGFSVALQPINLVSCFFGTLVGTLVGVLPGLGPVAALALLFPLTFGMPPVTAIIMMAGVYYGAQYGGSTTSILVNIPGETASVVTCLDGHPMARQGRAGVALGISAFGSFIAGTGGVIGLMLFAPILGEVALSFGPPEFFSLTLLGLTLVSYLSQGPMTNSLIMAILGLLTGCIGLDIISGEQRLTYGNLTLMDGIGLVPVAMGFFGVAEVLNNITSTSKQQILKAKIKGLLPGIKDWKESSLPILRGTVLGFFVGMLPGPGATISSFASYAIEKRLSRYPEKFGNGAIEGVAGPESANNSAVSGAFIPLLSLGIPTNATVALLMGALMVHGIKPGPMFIGKYPDLFWGFVTSMYVGNVMLLLLNLPLIGLWVKVLKIPYAILFPFILLFCLIGVYSVNNSIEEILIMLIFGLLGFLIRQVDFDAAPFVLAMVLGPIMEHSLRQSLLISEGQLAIFFMRPISAGMMILSLVSLVSPLIPALKRGREYISR